MTVLIFKAVQFTVINSSFRERMKVRRVNTKISLKVISLKLFLSMASTSPADNVTTRVAWMFSWRVQMCAKPLGCSREQNPRHVIGYF